MSFDQRSNERIVKEIKQHERRVRGNHATSRARPANGVNVRFALVQAPGIGMRQTNPNNTTGPFQLGVGKVKFFALEQQVNNPTGLQFEIVADTEDTEVYNPLNRAFTTNDEVIISGNLIIGVNLKSVWEYKLFSAETSAQGPTVLP